MRREINTVLFIIVGVLFNLAMMAGLFLGLVFVLARVFSPLLTENVAQILMVAALLISVVGTIYTYQKLIKWLQKKYDFSKYFAAFSK